LRRSQPHARLCTPEVRSLQGEDEMASAMALVPLFILWFGNGETPKIALVALGAAFPIYLYL
jgi:ABC-type nitrate/sulfonate/bicarbonate transport system permease component